MGADQRYELIERIGSGGMGAVYRARDHKLGCERAVKVLDAKYAVNPTFVERFRREAMAASRISHVNIVSVVDVAGEGERPVFLVMELLEGKTISQLVRGKGRLPWPQVQRYVDQIAAGLGAAHAQGVVHRDVKPGNCLVLADGQVKVLDFGIAKVTDMPAEVVALTAAGEIIGTCSYMAPEQIRGQVDKRSDIYALGALTFRMLTGRVPFSHREQDKVLLAHLTEPPPPPSRVVAGLPEGVDALVLRMLAKQPHQRFEDMGALRRALAQISGEPRAELSRRPSAGGEPERSPGRAPGSHHRAPASGMDGTAGAAGAAPLPDDGPTQAVSRDLSPSSEQALLPGDGRPRINTAPVGSGTLAELDSGSPAARQTVRSSGTVELDALSDVSSSEVTVARSQGTVVLDDPPDAPRRGGTVVVTPAEGPPPHPPSGPQPLSPPRVLTDVAAGDAPARVTRLASPDDAPLMSASMARGVRAAIGGVALALFVVVAWALWSGRAGPERVISRPEPSQPSAVPAALVSDGGESTLDAAGGPTAGTSGETSTTAGGGDGRSSTAGDEGDEGDSGSGVPQRAAETGAAEGTTSDPDAKPTPLDVRRPTRPRGSRSRGGSRTRRGDDGGVEPAPAPEPAPEPTPDPTPEPDPTRKAGDLRDPF